MVRLLLEHRLPNERYSQSHRIGDHKKAKHMIDFKARSIAKNKLSLMSLRKLKKTLHPHDWCIFINITLFTVDNWHVQVQFMDSEGNE